VAVINSHRDFEIARDQRWYRIPVERAPSRVGADYLALYQTRLFKEERWAINYYAPIRRYRVVPRRRLLPHETEHPRADAQYYKIEIGGLRRLPRSIPSRRLRRVTFIPTTLERLLTAEEINDLWCGTTDEEELWRTFKERGISAERRYPLRETDEQCTVDFALFCRRGRIAVCIDSEATVENVRIIRERPLIDEYEAAALGWTVVRLDGPALETSPSGCLQRTLEAAKRIGGLTEAPTVGQSDS
jgi:hypothetical protein